MPPTSVLHARAVATTPAGPSGIVIFRWHLLRGACAVRKRTYVIGDCGAGPLWQHQPVLRCRTASGVPGA